MRGVTALPKRGDTAKVGLALRTLIAPVAWEAAAHGLDGRAVRLDFLLAADSFHPSAADAAEHGPGTRNRIIGTRIGDGSFVVYLDDDVGIGDCGRKGGEECKECGGLHGYRC